MWTICLYLFLALHYDIQYTVYTPKSCIVNVFHSFFFFTSSHLIFFLLFVNQFLRAGTLATKLFPFARAFNLQSIILYTIIHINSNEISICATFSLQFRVAQCTLAPEYDNFFFSTMSNLYFICASLCTCVFLLLFLSSFPFCCTPLRAFILYPFIFPLAKRITISY